MKGAVSVMRWRGYPVAGRPGQAVTIMSPHRELIRGATSVAFDDLIMTQQHPDLADEQAYIEHAYDCLEASRKAAFRVRGLNEASMGGTFQARFERNAFDGQLVRRLEELELGDASLVFGRIDRYAESADQLEAFHIGRLAVADEDREPVVVDWRAPVAEPFYRATGRDTMGLARRRHFIIEGRNLLAK